MQVNITNGALTTVAELPAKFQSLSRSADGKLVAMSRLQSDGNVTVVEVSSGGSVSELTQFLCLDTDCQKVWSDGKYYYFVPSPGNYPLKKQNITGETISLFNDIDFLSSCVEPSSRYGCGEFSYTDFRYEKFSDVSYHAPSQSALLALVYDGGMTNLFRYNTTSGVAYTVMDFHHAVSDMAYFQYDAAWCSNRGTWNGDICVCNNAGIVGSRCETVLPPPVAAPPVVAPTAAPVVAPAAAPAAAPVATSAPTKAASPAPKAVSTANPIRFELCELAIVVAAVLANALYNVARP
jgi:hypothetical protein